AQRPGLDQQPLVPERFADLTLRDPIDPHRELELRRGLNLGVHAAEVASDVEQPIRARPLSQPGTGKPPRTDLVPRRRSHAADLAWLKSSRREALHTPRK